MELFSFTSYSERDNEHPDRVVQEAWSHYCREYPMSLDLYEIFKGWEQRFRKSNKFVSL